MVEDGEGGGRRKGSRNKEQIFFLRSDEVGETYQMKDEEKGKKRKKTTNIYVPKKEGANIEKEWKGKGLD